MTADNTVTFYTVIVMLLIFALAFIVIWSRRELHMRLVAVAIALALVPIIWSVFAQLPGKPHEMSAKMFRANYRCTMITPVELEQNQPILLLAQKEDALRPEYLVIAWDRDLAISLQKSMREAKRASSGSIIYGGTACIGEEDADSGGGKEGKKGKKGKGKGGKGKRGNGDGSSGKRQPGNSGQERVGADDFTFYPDPVPPMPEKDYGP